MKTWHVVAISAAVAAPLVAVGVVGMMRGWFTSLAPSTTSAPRS